jgi:excisionase family DNA binding protein
MEESKPFLTVPEVARLIGASQERTYALCSGGDIPSVKLGKRVRIPRAAFDRWLTDLSERALAGVADAPRR